MNKFKVGDRVIVTLFCESIECVGLHGEIIEIMENCEYCYLVKFEQGRASFKHEELEKLNHE